MTSLETRYAAAREIYAALGVDTELAVQAALDLPVALHCWQADDCAGLEHPGQSVASGGLLATGNFPGRARDGDEMRADFEAALRLLPGRHRLNLHAMYADYDGPRVDRDALGYEHFARWVDWCKATGLGFDFNATYFAHPQAASGYTLSASDAGVRAFWVRHGVACRRIAERAAREMGGPVVLNHWIPDGQKDAAVDRWSPRARLAQSLDAIVDARHGVSRELCLDAVEGKLFGLGTEDYTVGSNEFYAAYALTRGILLCMDMGHFHPTESVAEKFSALLQFHPRLLVHVSRPMRWDSDHVVVRDDALRAVFHELVRGCALHRVFVALDYFDASINRVGAYVIGVRATRKALLEALLEPVGRLQQLEREGRGAARLAWLEEAKDLPFGPVWETLCARAGVPAGPAYMAELERYEADVLRRRA